MLFLCVGISAVTVQLAFFLSGVSTGILRVLCTNATVDPFGKALLVCTAKGIPGDASITMNWKYDGKTSGGQPEVGFLGNDTNHVVTKSGHQTSLVIHEIAKNDAGPYRCVMAAVGETVSKAAFVFVKPFMSFFAKSVSVQVGQTARIECSTWGWEDPRIAWYRNGRQLEVRPRSKLSRSRYTTTAVRRPRRGHRSTDDDDGRLSLSPNSEGQSDGLLRLIDVQFTDRAVYNCTVTNSHGSNSRSTILRVHGKWRWVWPLITVVVESAVVVVVLSVAEFYRKRKRLRVNDVRSPSVNVDAESLVHRRNRNENNSKNRRQVSWSLSLASSVQCPSVDQSEDIRLASPEYYHWSLPTQFEQSQYGRVDRAASGNLYDS